MIRVFTDSAANIPAELLEKYQMRSLSFHLFVNGEERKIDGAFDGKRFYDEIRAGAHTKTSLVNTFDFTEGFEQALKNGEDVIYVGVSSGISGTHQAAVLAMDDLDGKYPGRRIAVIDTLAASMGEGLPALYAAQLAQQGEGFDAVVEKTQAQVKCMNQYFTVDDLGHLQRGGRVSRAAAIVGTLLNIKPMLHGDAEGKIEVYEKVRGRKKSLDALAQKYLDIARDKAETFSIAHSDCEKDVQYLIDKLRAGGCTAEIITVMYEPTTGSHVGPGAVAMFFYGKPKE